MIFRVFCISSADDGLFSTFFARRLQAKPCFSQFLMKNRKRRAVFNVFRSSLTIRQGDPCRRCRYWRLWAMADAHSHVWSRLCSRPWQLLCTLATQGVDASQAQSPPYDKLKSSLSQMEKSHQGLCAHSNQPALGGRYHLHSHSNKRCMLSASHHRCLFSQGSRMGIGRHPSCSHNNCCPAETKRMPAIRLSISNTNTFTKSS